MGELQVFESVLPLIVVAGGAVMWLGRLEAKAKNTADQLVDLTKRHERLVDKHDALESKIIDKLSAIERSLAKIEGRLLNMSQEEK